MRAGDTVYWAHPDEVERVTLLEQGMGDFNLKDFYRRSLRKPWVIRNVATREEWVIDESMLFTDPLAASIASAEMMKKLEREDEEGGTTSCE
jgi:hypothetical protein